MAELLTTTHENEHGEVAVFIGDRPDRVTIRFDGYTPQGKRVPIYGYMVLKQYEHLAAEYPDTHGWGWREGYLHREGLNRNPLPDGYFDALRAELGPILARWVADNADGIRAGRVAADVEMLQRRQDQHRERIAELQTVIDRAQAGEAYEMPRA